MAPAPSLGTSGEQGLDGLRDDGSEHAYMCGPVSDKYKQTSSVPEQCAMTTLAGLARMAVKHVVDYSEVVKAYGPTSKRTIPGASPMARLVKATLTAKGWHLIGGVGKVKAHQRPGKLEEG